MSHERARGTQPFAADDVAEVVDLAARTARERALRTGTVTRSDAAAAVVAGVRAFLDDTDRAAFVVREHGQVVAFLGAITSRLTPNDESYTYLPPEQALVPLSASLASDADSALRCWPHLLKEVRARADHDGIPRVTTQALAGDIIAGSIWRAAGLRPDTTLAMRPVASLAPASSDGVTVRPATTTDTPALTGLLHEEILHHARATRCGVSPDQNPQTLDLIVSRWIQREAPENIGHAFIAQEGDVVAGVVVVNVLTIPESSPASFTLPHRHGYIGLASTGAQHRGRGIGSALTEQALLWLRSLPEPPETVALHYSTDNGLGAPFWSHRGFTPVMETLSLVR